MAENDQTPPNDEQAKALVEALAPAIAAAILPQISESVERQIGGLKEKNDQLLGSLHKQRETSEQQQTALDAALKRLGQVVPQRGGEDVVISRDDARDPAKYRAAKVEAEKRGVAVKFEGRNE